MILTYEYKTHIYRIKHEDVTYQIRHNVNYRPLDVDTEIYREANNGHEDVTQEEYDRIYNEFIRLK